MRGLGKKCVAKHFLIVKIVSKSVTGFKFELQLITTDGEIMVGFLSGSKGLVRLIISTKMMMHLGFCRFLHKL